MFSEILKNTFSIDNTNSFDEDFKLKVENTIRDYNFKPSNMEKVDLCNIKDLNLVIKNIKKHSAIGEDKIHNMMIKNSTLEFRKIILTLVNQSIRFSTVPQNWKNSMITMLSKKNYSCSNLKDQLA